VAIDKQRRAPSHAGPRPGQLPPLAVNPVYLPQSIGSSAARRVACDESVREAALHGCKEGHGSCRGGPKGYTYQATREFLNELEAFDGIETEVVRLADYHLEPCRGCKACFAKGEEICPLKDDRDVEAIALALLGGEVGRLCPEVTTTTRPPRVPLSAVALGRSGPAAIRRPSDGPDRQASVPRLTAL